MPHTLKTISHEGVDVTRLLGTDQPCLERDLYELFQAHWKRAVAEPKVENFRLCVEAHDAFLAAFHGEKP